MKSSRNRRSIRGNLTINKAARMILEQKVRRTWQKDLESMVSFLERVQALRVPDSDKWSYGQARYFKNRCSVLLSVTPEDCRDLAAAFRRRLSKITILE